MRVKLIKQDERVRESLDNDDYLDVIGLDDDDASLHFDDDSSECLSGGGKDEGLMQGVDVCDGKSERWSRQARKEPLNPLTGVFLKSVFFLDKCLSMSVF